MNKVKSKFNGFLDFVQGYLQYSRNGIMEINLLRKLKSMTEKFGH